MRPIDADALTKEIKDLKESPWFNTGKERNSDAWLDVPHLNFLARKEAVETVVDLCINEAPTIEPDRPHGEWKQITEPDIWGKTKYQCSVCKYVHRHSEFDTISFCENCGADMRREVKNNDKLD